MLRFLAPLGIVAAVAATLLATTAEAAQFTHVIRPAGATGQIASGLGTAGEAAQPAGAAGQATATGTRYYLALGDSLAAGAQPVRPLDRTQGYVYRLHDKLRQTSPGLELKNVGCGGETSQTLIAGGHCSFPAGSQLAAAEQFLRAHPGKVSLVTLDIGANDFNACRSGTSVNQGCVQTTLAKVSANVTRIVARLRAAAPGVEMIAMTYYDAFLATYLQGGAAGKLAAALSLELTNRLNAVLKTVYETAGVKVADVSGAFATNDSTTMVTVSGIGRVPLNVARICQWTWMCVHNPPDVHANAEGYQVIANAFFQEH